MTSSPTCLIVDASCDLPEHLLSDPRVRVLPIKVRVNQKEILDTRDLSATAKFHKEELTSPSANDGQSEPISIDEMVAAFNTSVAPYFDHAVGVFVSSTRSPMFNRARLALPRVRIETAFTRMQAGRTMPMDAFCLDSKMLFAGYGVQALDLFDLVEKGALAAAVAERQRQIAPLCFAYMAPGNVEYILQRAALKGEKSVSGLAAFMATSFSITPIIRGLNGETAPVAKRLGRARAQQSLFTAAQSLLSRRLLKSRHICFSYSGALTDIESQAGYREVVAAAQTAGARVYLTPMSITGSVNVGPDALVLGVVAELHTFSDMC